MMLKTHSMKLSVTALLVAGAFGFLKFFSHPT